MIRIAGRKAVIFAMDRTLVDPSSLMQITANNWALNQGLPRQSRIGDCRGRVWPTRIRQVFQGIDEAGVRTIQDELEVDSMHLLRRYPNLLGSVNRSHYLTAAIPDGMWAICTDNTEALTRTYLRTAHHHVPSVVISRDHFGATDRLLKTFEALGVNPEDGLVVASSKAALTHARNIGASVITMGSGGHNQPNGLNDFGQIDIDYDKSGISLAYSPI